MTSPPKDNEQPSTTAALVRGLLDRHGIPKHKQSSVVEEFFRLSRSAAHRRVHGSAPWNVDELERLAAHYGETLVELFGGASAADGEVAVFLNGGLSTRCQAWLGEETASREGYVAVRMGTRLLVMPGRDAGDKAAFKVLRFTVDQTLPNL